MALKEVEDALRNLIKNEAEDCNSTSSEEDVASEYFCVEDTFLSSEITVSVEGIGKLQFPISHDSAKSLIEISSKAKFGRGEETLLDTSIRDTQVIPADMLKVQIDEDSLNTALERIGCGLNINKSCPLVPYLYNMLIYGPGQFFKMHRDSSKQKNMMATLVIVLPCEHKGGELIIQHNNKTHIFSGSTNPKVVKCVVFYSDCKHEIKKVTEGYRIALTYNVVLKPISPLVGSSTNINAASGINVDESLNKAVDLYFSNDRHPKKLVYLLNHSYSENNLRWELLKGTDRTCASSLFAVAKIQNKIPCLALCKYHEVCDSYELSEVYDTSTELYFWVDEHDLRMLNCEKSVDVSDNEVCYTMETKDLFEPYETEESGPTGNEGETTENWYRRGCVVIWFSKWNYCDGFNNALNDLHYLTTEPENEKKIMDEIKQAGADFYQPEFWNNPNVSKKLIDIAIYVNDAFTAEFILSKFPREVLDNIHNLLKLEKQYDKETWAKILNTWKSSRWALKTDDAISFVKRYMVHHFDTQKSVIINFVLKEAVESFIKTKHIKVNSYYNYFNAYRNDNTPKLYPNSRTDDHVMEEVYNLLDLCIRLNNFSLQEQLIQHICASSNEFKPVNLGELFLKLRGSEALHHVCPYLKILQESALTKIKAHISELSNCHNDWFIDIKISCSCMFCTSVQAFFHSKTNKRVVIPASKPNRRHIYSNLNYLSGYPIKFYTERTGSPFKIIIEKEPNLLKDRMKLSEDLIMLKEQLESSIDPENLELASKRRKILMESNDAN